MQKLIRISSIPYEVKPVDKETVALTLVMPIANVNAIVMMLSCFYDLFKGLSWKAKTNPATLSARAKEIHAESRDITAEYENAVVKMYVQYIDKNNTPRESLSLTASKISETYDFSSFDMVKSCLTKNKLLKNTGFYKSRHKIT